MSDFKSKFAAAKAQRKSAAPSREQLKALRAQKAASAAVAAQSQPAPALQQSHRDVRATEIRPLQDSGPSSIGSSALGPSQVTHAEQQISQQPAGTVEVTESGLPAGFFDEAGGKSDGSLQPSVNASELSTAAHSADVAGGAALDGSSAAGLPEGFFDTASPMVQDGDTGVHGAAPTEVPIYSTRSRPASATPVPIVAQIQDKISTGPLPKDFFADKAAGAKASGLPVQKKKTTEEQMAEFNKAVASDVLAAEEAEEVEATDFAAERAAREAFEQRQRLAAVEELRSKAAAARQRPADSTSAAAALATATADIQPSDTAPNGVQNSSGGAPLGGSGTGEPPLKRRKRALDVFDDSGSSSSEEEGSDAALDWRAKAL